MGERLIGVRTEVVLETLVSDLHALAQATPQRLDLLGHPDPRARAIAALGYAARAAELERFEAARGPMPWLAEEIARHQGDAAAACAALADREPRRRPDPGDEAVGWLAPGPGGHVRHFLAMRAADAVIGEDADRPPVAAVKRWWTYGFLMRCCEEQDA
jgi:hypothetical protein